MMKAKRVERSGEWRGEEGDEVKSRRGDEEI
jgi:hypothetical protein